ncbi:MAG: Na+/H+ antiporter NhaA [Planctomycetota bacterium]|jgi:NhaA family Na+:H+ antiporter
MVKKTVNILQEFSIPLILGVIVALVVANNNYERYDKLIHTPLYEIGSVFSDAHDSTHGAPAGEHAEDAGEHAATAGDAVEEAAATIEHALSEAGEHAVGADHGEDGAGEHDEAHGDGHGHGFGHYFTLHFLVNEIFMVFFFGIAAKEITESMLPGGALNPMKNAINPLLGTIGGVLGPVGVYFGLNLVMGRESWNNGWGIPTATDIALAWLVARTVFGAGHPAISFLLLLAVADDGIGLVIIALFYPNMPPEWINALWILPGMLVAFQLRRMNVQTWIPYIAIGGAFSWWGLYSAHLHPALALVFIVPFLPGPKEDIGMFREEQDYDQFEHEAAKHHHHGHTPLDNFEHSMKLPVDFGLFFFAFANAGVLFSGISNLTWIVFLSLLFGKIIGIFGFSFAGSMIGFPLPAGMKPKHLLVAGMIAGIGLTVALFVSGQAFKATTLVGAADQGAAKMGALFSGAICLIAYVTGKALGVNDGAGAKSSDRI